MNTHKSYVSLETAKLLKQAGFDWECDYHYPGDNNLCHGFCNNDPTFKVIIAAPTLEVAQRWLRENREVDINVLTDFDAVHRFYTVRYIIKLGHYKIFTINDKRDCLQYFNTYEEALEVGIQKCLTILSES